MADHDVEGHLRVIRRVLLSAEWKEICDALALQVESFETVRIPYETSDSELWRICQQNEIVLITGNRNLDGRDSLENTIRELSTESTLPVLTLSEPKRIFRDHKYLEAVVESLLEFLFDLDNYRGTGRLYLP